jgi:hypothetical protein
VLGVLGLVTLVVGGVFGPVALRDVVHNMVVLIPDVVMAVKDGN